MGKLLIVIILIIIGYAGWLFYSGQGSKLPSLPSMPSLSSLTGPAEGTWHEVISDAKDDAKSKNRPIFILFTVGDNYSGTSTQFENDVMQKESLQEYIKKRFVLVRLDYSPLKERVKSPIKKQHDEQAAMNNQVTSFPRVCIYNTEGIKVADIGYQPGTAWSTSPSGLLQEIESQIKGKPNVPSTDLTIPKDEGSSSTASAPATTTPTATTSTSSPTPPPSEEKPADPAPAAPPAAPPANAPGAIQIEGY